MEHYYSGKDRSQQEAPIQSYVTPSGAFVVASAEVTVVYAGDGSTIVREATPAAMDGQVIPEISQDA